MLPFDIHERGAEDRNMDLRALFVSERSKLSEKFLTKANKLISNVLPSYFARFNVVREADERIRKLALDSLISRNTKLFSFDESMTKLRKECEAKVEYALNLAEHQLSEVRQSVDSETSSVKAKIDTSLDLNLELLTRDHLVRLERSRSEYTRRIDEGSEKIREMKRELNRLELLRDRNSKLLMALKKKNRVLKEPVKELEKQVKEMENRVKIFEAKTKPELEIAKNECNQLRTEIREKSFLLECLIQRTELLHIQRDKRKTDAGDCSVSVAETDIPY